jgi:SAM-dependent methyltransferase
MHMVDRAGSRAPAAEAGRRRTAVERLSERYYPRDEYADDNALFFGWIREHLNSDSDVLEIGAGAGLKWPYDFAGVCRSVVGVDTDPRVLANPNLTRAVCGDFLEVELGEDLFDVAFANNVAEHVEAPERFLRTCQRVVRPGGLVFLKTPNRLHYVSLIARLSPHAFHVWVNRLRGRAEEDTFPTYYRMNTATSVASLSGRLGLECEFRRFEGRPEYLKQSAPLFLMGVAYERAANALPLLSPLRCVLLFKLSMPGGRGRP